MTSKWLVIVVGLAVAGSLALSGLAEAGKSHKSDKSHNSGKSGKSHKSDRSGKSGATTPPNNPPVATDTSGSVTKNSSSPRPAC